MNNETTNATLSVLRPVLVGVDLTKKYWGKNSVPADSANDRDELVIIDNLNFSLLRGERVAITGVSGSGKSTLLHLLGGLDKPQSGEVLLEGKSLYGASEEVRNRYRQEKLGFIYQFHYLMAELTALENAALPLLVAGIERNAALERAKIQLTEVGLGARVRHYPAELSGGERQRVAVARAVIHRPQCLLADEPTGSLDHDNAQTVWQLLMGLCKTYDTSLILVTHDPKLAQVCDKHYQLVAGKLHLR